MQPRRTMGFGSHRKPGNSENKQIEASMVIKYICPVSLTF